MKAEDPKAYWTSIRAFWNRYKPDEFVQGHFKFCAPQSHYRDFDEYDYDDLLDEYDYDDLLEEYDRVDDRDLGFFDETIPGFSPFDPEAYDVES